MALTKPTYAVNNIQSLADIVKDQATAVKVAHDKTGADTKAYLEDLCDEIDALDAANMKKTGNQTIDGVKTFTSSPIVPTPTTDGQAANKEYVDSQYPINIPNASIGDLKLSDASGDIKARFESHLADNTQRFGRLITTPEDFIVEGETDNTNQIQRAIDYCYEKNGGKVYLYGKTYNVSSPIHIKENVELVGDSETVINYTALSNPVLIFYNRAKAEEMTITVSTDYDDNILFLSNEYIRRAANKDTSSNAKIFIEKIKAKTTHKDGRLKNCGIKLYAATNASANSTGFWGVNVKDCYFYGFDTIISLEVGTNGWVNGNIFTNIVADYFVNYVTVVKNGLEISGNYFYGLTGQVESISKEMIVDIYPNVYENCNFFDLKSFESASLGFNRYVRGYSQSYFSESLPLSLYATSNFQKIGTFYAMNSSAYATFRINGYKGKISTEIVISFDGGSAISNAIVVRKHYGDYPVDNSLLKFYLITRSNGYTDLYMRVFTINTDIDVMSMGTSLFMFEHTSVTKSTLPGSTEIAVERNIEKIFYVAAVATAARPTTKTLGQMAFDTTLNKPIWWNGTVWVDATGATV